MTEVREAGDTDSLLIVNHGLVQIRTSGHVIEDVDPLDLGDTTFKYFHDPIAFAFRLDDGDVYELAIDRSENPLPVPTER